MKQLAIITALCVAAPFASAQVEVTVLAPIEFAGSVEFGSGVWAMTPDLSDPDNAVTGSLVFVESGATGDSLGCSTLVNAAAIEGNIAFVYRGTCDYGTKAMNAQLAGATAVVVVNNSPGSPTVMGPGTLGDEVTIPVVMISLETGALLHDAIEAGSVVMKIGAEPPPPPMVFTYLVIPSDMSHSQAELDSIKQAMFDVQAWYQFETCGRTYVLPDPLEVTVYTCSQPRQYYEGDWWDLVTAEMIAAGHPLFTEGHISALWLKGASGSGIALGGSSCAGTCGVAMVSIEGWPAFNPGTYSNPCQPSPPCTPRGVMTHELGHAFGLWHPDDPLTGYHLETVPYYYHSPMGAWWHYPYTPAIGTADSPWGLLTREIEVLWANPALVADVQLAPIYPDAPLVNLPVLGPLPTADFGFSMDDDSVYFMNLSTGATRYYWMFGSESVSTVFEPTIPLPDAPMSVQLVVANEDVMMARTIEDVDPSGTNGSADLNETPKYILSPNPAQDFILLSGAAAVGSRSVCIQSADGKPIIWKTWPERQEQLSIGVDHLAPGVYSVLIREGGICFFLRLSIGR